MDFNGGTVRISMEGQYRFQQRHSMDLNGGTAVISIEIQ